MVVTLDGIVMDAKLLQPENIRFPMEVMLDGRVTDSRLLQPENTHMPKEVTLDGMITDVNPLPAKALVPMYFTLDGIVTDAKLLEPMMNVPLGIFRSHNSVVRQVSLDKSGAESV